MKGRSQQVSGHELCQGVLIICQVGKNRAEEYVTNIAQSPGFEISMQQQPTWHQPDHRRVVILPSSQNELELVELGARAEAV